MGQGFLRGMQACVRTACSGCEKSRVLAEQAHTRACKHARAPGSRCHERNSGAAHGGVGVAQQRRDLRVRVRHEVHHVAHV